MHNTKQQQYKDNLAKGESKEAVPADMTSASEGDLWESLEAELKDLLKEDNRNVNDPVADEDWEQFVKSLSATEEEGATKENNKKAEVPSAQSCIPNAQDGTEEEKTACQGGFSNKTDGEKTRKAIHPLWIVLAAVVVIATAVIWFFSTNVVVDGKVYSKKHDVLDLRSEEITEEHYNAVREKLPGQLIYWNVPFQNGAYSNDIQELTITQLSDEDIAMLSYFRQLETVHGENCEEYDKLVKLQEAYPNCSVLYTVAIDGEEYAQDATELTVANLTDAEVALTDYLPLLETVNAEECENYAQLVALQERRPDCAIHYSVKLGEKKYALDTKSLNLTNQDLPQLLERLEYLPAMEKVHLVDPLGNAETMTALLDTYPNVAITSELVGVSVSEDGKEVDLSAVTLAKIEDVDKYMAFYPDAEKAYLGMPEIDNETIAAFRESKRQDYKVVWTVMCGTIPTRTDDIYFHPIQEGVYYFFDEDAYNLRYCEDMICVDVGHMSLHDISWVENMPNLQYLILCLTTVLDITPLSTCKNLIFLELDMTGIRDYTPLLGCTSLQDLNLGMTYGDPAPIAQMTWLKNLWWKDKGYATMAMLKEALPNTNMNFSPPYTSGGGWRKLPNYYAMRDIMGMHYMN